MSGRFRTAMLLVMLVAVAIVCADAAVRAGQSKSTTQVLTPEQLPPELIAKIQQAAPGVQIKSAEKVTRQGKTSYVVKILDAGAELTIKVTEDGKVLTKGFNPATGNTRPVLINLDQLPTSARDAVARIGGAARPSKVTQETRDGGVIYTAVWDMANGPKSLEVTPEGQASAMQVPVDTRAVPTLVQAVANEAADGAANLRFSQRTTMVFVAEAEVDGQVREFLITPSGKLAGHSTVKQSSAKSDKPAIKPKADPEKPIPSAPTNENKKQRTSGKKTTQKR